MYQDNMIVIGETAQGAKCSLLTRMANRHGMVAGATGTGKTTTIKALAQDFSAAGVPVFLADVKGDLGGMAEICPVNFWDLYGEKGMPLRTTISEMGPVLLSRILNLTQVQSDVLQVVFKIADDEGLLLIDTKDLRAMLNHCGEREVAKEYALKYGSMSGQSIAAIVRAVVAMEADGGDVFFGEPALSMGDWICTDNQGRGVVQIMDCTQLIHHPAMYGTFMMWLISELYETMPEVGDLDRPKAVFFFDEAHLLFNNAPKYLMDKLEQTVKLIRSKGVGLYFISQSPKDIPDGVLAQLGNKIQHGLHVYTPTEQKAAKAAADSYRANPEFDTYDTLINLGIGEALISFLDENGAPGIVEKAKIMPGQMVGTIDDSVRDKYIKSSLLYTRYADYIDRDSAYEFLTRLNMEKEASEAKAKEDAIAAKRAEKEAKELAKAQAKQAEREAREAAKEKDRFGKEVKRAAESTAKTTAGTVGRQVGNVFGSAVGGKFGKTLGGNIGASLGRGIMGVFLKK